MENDRREDPQNEPVSSQGESPAYEQQREQREDFASDDAPRGDDRARDTESEGAPMGEQPPTFSSEGHSPDESGALPPGDQEPSQGGQASQGQQDRGGRGRRGRGRRLSQRDRRNQDRNRGRREHRPQFSSSHHGGHQQGGGSGQPSHHRDQGQETLREGGQQSGQTGASILADVRAEVERLREVLEGVLRDLEDVSEQLIKAEHEKDIAEAEIEQLRDQLRRLHR